MQLGADVLPVRVQVGGPESGHKEPVKRKKEGHLRYCELDEEIYS